MRRLWTNPWFAVGLFLTLLGFGNWYTGADKTKEYERLLQQQGRLAVLDNFEDFPLLDERTNATLLRPLHRTGSGFTMAAGKLDFYRLVRTGGEIVMLAGAFIAAAAAIHSLYRQRSWSTS